MCIRGDVDWVATEDVDALVFGAPKVLRGITTSSPTLVSLASVLEQLEMTYETFVDMCILSGSDFTPKPKGFGPATSYKLLSQTKRGLLVLL
jgi:flap endonuclease-1